MKKSALRLGTVAALTAPLLLLGALPASASWQNGGSTFLRNNCENGRKMRAYTYGTTNCYSYLARDPNSSSKLARIFWTYDYWTP